MRRPGAAVAAMSLLANLVACHPLREREGKAAVTAYLDKLAKAYRASDEDLVDPLLGEQQALKVLGLIGVKRDLGLVLDASLVDLQFDRVSEEGQALLVDTRERWHYVDRRIGTGEPVGAASDDAYALRYRFERDKGKLKLVDLAFREEPRVGREAPVYRLDASTAHGSLPEAPALAAAPGASAAAAAPVAPVPAPSGGAR